jgi:hypothetical protein
MLEKRRTVTVLYGVDNNRAGTETLSCNRRRIGRDKKEQAHLFFGLVKSILTFMFFY